MRRRSALVRGLTPKTGAVEMGDDAQDHTLGKVAIARARSRSIA